jgi:hypothetical protein
VPTATSSSKSWKVLNTTTPTAIVSTYIHT